MGLMRNACAKWVFLLFLPFLFVLFSHSSAHAQWASVIPPDVSEEWDLRGVHFTSADEGWAVGPNWGTGRGVLLHYRTGSVPGPLLQR
jgi:hypothetical protein